MDTLTAAQKSAWEHFVLADPFGENGWLPYENHHVKTLWEAIDHKPAQLTTIFHALCTQDDTAHDLAQTFLFLLPATWTPLFDLAKPADQAILEKKMAEIAPEGGSAYCLWANIEYLLAKGTLDATNGDFVCNAIKNEFHGFCFSINDTIEDARKSLIDGFYPNIEKYVRAGFAVAPEAQAEMNKTLADFAIAFKVTIDEFDGKSGDGPVTLFRNLLKDTDADSDMDIDDESDTE